MSAAGRERRERQRASRRRRRGVWRRARERRRTVVARAVLVELRGRRGAQRGLLQAWPCEREQRSRRSRLRRGGPGHPVQPGACPRRAASQAGKSRRDHLRAAGDDGRRGLRRPALRARRGVRALHPRARRPHAGRGATGARSLPDPRSDERRPFRRPGRGHPRRSWRVDRVRVSAARLSPPA